MTNKEFDNSVFNLNILKTIGSQKHNNLSVGITRRMNKIRKVLEKVKEEEVETRKIAEEKGYNDEETTAEVEVFWGEEFKHPFEPLVASFFEDIKEEVIRIEYDKETVSVTPSEIVDLLIERGVIVE